MTHRSAGKELHATAAPYVPSPAMWQDMYGAGPMATFDPNMAGMAIMPDTAVPLTMYAAVPPGMTIEVYDAEVKANVNIPAECLFTTYGGLSAVQQGRNAGAKPKVCASFVASSCRAGDSCRDIHTMPQALMAERSRIYTWMHTKEAEFINHPEATYKVFYSDLKEVISVPASALVFTRGLFLDPLDREKRPSGGASHGGRNGNPTVAQQAPTACGLFAANPASCKWGRFCNQAHVSSSWIEDHRKHFEEWSSTLESEFNMLSPDTTFTIHDPLRRALIRVPKDRIATFTRGLLQGTTDKCPSVCLLSLNGRCTAGGRCNQAHVEPKWLSEQTDQSESMVESTAVGSRNHSDNSISDSRQGSMQSIGAASSPPLSRPPNNAAHHHHHQHHHHQHHHQQRGVPLQQDGMMVQAAFPPVEMMFFPHRHHHHHHHHHMQSHSHMQTQMLQQHEAYMMQQQQHHHDTMMQQQHLQAQQEAAYLASQQQQQQQQAQHDGGRRAVAPPPPVDTNVNHSPPQQYTNNHNVPVPIGHSSPPSPIHQRFSQNPSRHAPPNLTLSNALAPETPPDTGMPSAPQSVGLSPIRPPGSNRGGGAIAPPQFTNNTNYGAMRTPDTLGYGFAPFDMPNTPNVMPRTPLTGGGGRGGGSLNFSFPAPSAIGQGAISPLLRSTTGPSALRVSLTGFEDVFRDGFLGGDGPGDSLTALPPSLSAAQNRPPAAPRGGSNDPSNSSSQHPLLEGGLASLTSPPQSGYMPDNAPTTPLSLKSPSRVAPRNPRYSPATRPSLLTPVETSPPGS